MLSLSLDDLDQVRSFETTYLSRRLLPWKKKTKNFFVENKFKFVCFRPKKAVFCILPLKLQLVGYLKGLWQVLS